MARSVEPDDHALLQGIARGEATALEGLIHRHRSWAVRLLLRVLGSHAVAEDVLQSCFVQLWEKPPAWQPNAQFRTWFYRVLHNRCMDHFRHEQRHIPLPSDGEVDHPPAGDQGGLVGPAAVALALQATPGMEQGVMQRLDVQAALMTLPERQRMAIVLVYFEDLPQAEAAALMTVSVGALESLLSRARTQLSRHLAAHRH